MTFDTQLGMPVVLAIIVILLTLVLRKRNKSNTSRINLDDLLIDDVTGRTSPSRAVLLGSFAMTTWVIVYLAISGHLTEGYYSAYLLAWVAPAVAKIIKGQTASVDTTTATTTVTATTVNPPQEPKP